MGAPLLASRPPSAPGVVRRRLSIAVTRRGIGTAAALLALTACGSGSTEGNSNEMMAEQAQRSSPPSPAGPGPRADQAAVPAPATGGGAVPARSAIPAVTAVTARRCGWLHNPTPGNWWLEDRAGEWVLATQGGRQAGGMDEMPDMSALDWQEVNGNYGYGCACLTLTADPETREVAAVARPEPKPLAQCRADRTLPRP